VNSRCRGRCAGVASIVALVLSMFLVITTVRAQDKQGEHGFTSAGTPIALPIDPDAPPSGDDISAEQSITEHVSAAGLQSPYFDAAEYHVVVGQSVDITLTLQMDGDTIGGNGTVAPSYQAYFSAVSVSPSGGASFTHTNAVTPGTATNMTFTFSSIGAGSCVLGFTLTVPPDVAPSSGGADINTDFTTTTPFDAFSPRVPVFYDPLPLPMTVTASPMNPLAGDIVTVSVSHDDPALFIGFSSIQGFFPSDTLLQSGEAILRCSAGCSKATKPVETATSVSVDYATNPGTATTVTLEFKVQIPAGAAEGTSFTFSGQGIVIGDPSTATGPGSVSVTVSSPLAADSLSIVVPYGQTYSGNLTASNGVAPLTFDNSTLPDATSGHAVVNTDGSFTYTPDDGAIGSDSFTYTVTDSHDPVQVVTGLVSIEISEPVTAYDSSLTVPFEGSGSGTVTATGGIGAISYAVETPPAKGDLSLQPDGTYTYAARPGQFGADSFTFVASDSSSTPLTDRAEVVITIGAPDELVASTMTFTIDTESGSIFQGDLQPLVSGGIPPYVFSVLVPPTQGTLDLNPDGTFTYTANPGASGPDQFTYTVMDSAVSDSGVNAAASTVGTVSILIVAAPAATATLPDGPTATIPDRPVIPGKPVATATATPAPQPGNGGGTGDNTSTVSQLPSTGTGTRDDSLLTLMLIAGGLALVLGALVATLRQRHP